MAHKKYNFATQALPGNMQQRHKILHHTTSEICYHFTIMKQNIVIIQKQKTSPETTVIDLPENVLLSLYEINYIIFDLCKTKIWQRTFRV